MLKDIVVESVTRIVDDGNHNAFTDMAAFGEHYYLCYRSCPEGHLLSPNSRVRILESSDGLEWQECFSFQVQGRDVRDAHFLVFGETLFCYVGAWLLEPAHPGDTQSSSYGKEMNHHLGYCAWLERDRGWNGPRFLEGTYGHFVWRASTHDGKAYLCGRRKREFAVTSDSEEARKITQSAMLESDDGFVWRTRAFFQETQGNETAFLFEEDGTAVAVARATVNGPAQLCVARPPYDEWQRTYLQHFIGGPLLARFGGDYLVGGRKLMGPGPHKTVLYWLLDGQLREAALLPSGGDTGYPGFVETQPDRGLLSFYSSHEGSGNHLAPSAIYMARLRLK